MNSDRPLIGVLEDDEAVRDSIRWMLERSGFASRTFGTPNEFLLSRELDRYDCLVMDVGLPGMSGLELLELLRSRAYTKPVILIAATSDPHIEPRVRKAGASELLMKPIAPGILLSALHRATDSRGSAASPT